MSDRLPELVEKLQQRIEDAVALLREARGLLTLVDCGEPECGASACPQARRLIKDIAAYLQDARDRRDDR